VIARRLVLPAVALVALAFAASASASTISLKCGGKGPRNEDSAETVLCAAKPGKARTIEGVVRDDTNKPVAGPVTVTLSKWIPQDNDSYKVEKYQTLTVAANAAGKFSYAAKTDTKTSIAFEAAGATREAEVSRELQVTVKKLGGGKVQVSAKGAGKAKIKMFLVDESGYEVPGTKGRYLGKSGTAVFDLGRFHGTFSWVFEAGIYTDLFWTNRGPALRI
jgi:hypothetical protein